MELSVYVRELEEKVKKLEAELAESRECMSGIVKKVNKILGYKVTAKPVVSVIPSSFSANLTDAVEQWMEYKGNSLTAVGKQRAISHIGNVMKEEGELPVIEAIHTAMGNGWKGWDFPESRRTSKAHQPVAQKNFSITLSAVERRLAEMGDGECQSVHS